MHSSYDYIVVGGGSAGCTVAGRLAEENAGSVLLLERGDRAEANPDTLSADGFRHTFANDALVLDRISEPQATCANRTLYAGSGMGMGGSGGINGMVYTRGDKLDFSQWPAGWHWDDVEPVFQRLEQRLRVRSRHGTTFTEIALKAAEAVGFKRKHGLNDGYLNGFMGYNDMNFEADKRRNSYVAFIAELTSANLTVKTKSLVHRILFDDQQRAIGVDVTIDGHRRRIVANNEVILCAGALETPKLLMLSGVGPRQHLESLQIPVVQDAPAIGSNLQDHPNVTMFFRGKKPLDFGYPQIYGFYRSNPQLALPPEQADTCICWIAAPPVLKGSMERMGPAALLRGKRFFNPVLNRLIRSGVKLSLRLPGIGRFIDNLYGLAVILGKPVSRGTVRLASREADAPAIVDLAYYRDEADLETMLKGITVAQKIAAQANLQIWGNKPLVPASQSNDRDVLKKWIHGTTMTTFHYCGTCSMGEHAEAPVDTELRLKGIKNLRVADASVFPVVPVSALNAPSMMVGYRAADFILERKMQSA